MFMKQITKLEFDKTVNLKFCKNCYPNPIPAPRNVNVNFYKHNICMFTLKVTYVYDHILHNTLSTAI